MKTPNASKPLLGMAEGLDQADLPTVQAKIRALVSSGRVTLAQLATWCTAAGSECACRGCPNRHLTWAEWECWRKYDPGVNGRARVGDS